MLESIEARAATYPLSEPSRAALAVIRQEPGITAGELCRRLGVVRGRVANYLTTLQGRGLIYPLDEAGRQHFYPAPEREVAKKDP